MKMKVLLGSFALASCVSVSAYAEETKPTGSGPNPFSDCGIGAALFPKHPVGAVISNVIWDVGTTALTSATASPETCSGKSMEVAQYILKSYDSLAEDTAKGQGQHLDSLLDLIGVSADARQETVTAIRQQMAGIVSSKEYSTATQAQKAESFYSVVSSVNS